MATGDFSWNDRYAGDAAWREWFDVCSVSGCSPDSAAPLRTEIVSALVTHLLRAGITREEIEAEDPVLFFDAYFKLKGSRDRPKPLKSYFAYRIAAEGIRLKDFVCGTLFGAASGRVRDIVTDWIAVHKGWKGRTVTAADGRRHFVWESAGDGASSAPEQAFEPVDPAAFLDEEPLRAEARSILARVAEKTKVEKATVALLSFTTAQDISLTEPIVLAALGVGKSRAYLMRDKVMTAFERELARTEGADDALFARLLLETCEAALDPAVRQALEDAS